MRTWEIEYELWEAAEKILVNLFANNGSFSAHSRCDNIGRLFLLRRVS